MERPAERDRVIAALIAEVEQLKRRAGMDSSNSSMPPGSATSLNVRKWPWAPVWRKGNLCPVVP
jgi:hypothetical protein